MKITATNQKGTFDITGLSQTIKWSGDYQQAARTLEIGMTVSAADKKIPVVETPPGTLIQMREENTEFYGYVVPRTKNTESSTLTVTCFDRGWHLKKNKHIDVFENQTPEDITSSIAGQFGIKLGSIAKTGVKISRKFLSGTSLYDMIATVYTLASNVNGEKYHIGFVGEKLTVKVIKPSEKSLIIRGKSNLIGANVTETIENLVSEVAVYDAKGKLVKVFQDKEKLKLYGKLREVLKQSDKDNKFSQASTMLKEKGLEQKITVDNLGDLSCITGNSVIVEEPYTGLEGLFYIESDIHEWKRGQYYNKLTLSFKKIMYEKEAGEKPKE